MPGPGFPPPSPADLPIPGESNAESYNISTLPCLSADVIAQLATALVAALNKRLGTNYKYNSATVKNIAENVTLNVDVLPGAIGNVPVTTTIQSQTEPTSCTFHSQEVCKQFPYSIRDQGLQVPGVVDNTAHIMYGTDPAGTAITAIRVHGDVGGTGNLGAILAHALNWAIEQTRNGACIAKFD
jgi:hypothetical protein